MIWKNIGKLIITWLVLFPCSVHGASYYVSLNGNNSNGLTWATAWNEMDKINWTVLLPGDTIYLDGGSGEMVYRKGMTVGKDGDAGAPIIIRLSKESGRNGKAVIFGGRSTLMPYCGQASYSGEPVTVNTGISIGARGWIVIDGTKWEGITIHGISTGISIGGGGDADTAHDILLRNIKLYDIGSAEQRSDGKWYPSATTFGINFNCRGGGDRVTVERVIISCTGDNTFGGFKMCNIVIKQCWFDNGRDAPDGSPFNFCNHPDGYQTYVYNRVDGPWLIEDTIIGPRFMQGLFPGASTGSADPWRYVIVNNITCRNVLFVDNLCSNMLGANGGDWVFENITSYVSGKGMNNFNTLWACKGPFTFNDSIFYGGNSNIVTGTKTGSGNYCYSMSGSIPGSTQADPRFVNAAGYDFALQSNSPCKRTGGVQDIGSRVTSVAKLFELFPDEGTAPSAGNVQFSAAAYNVNETAGGAVITVIRTGGSIGAVSAQYSTTNGTAIAGSDYTAKSGMLNWPFGDSASKTFTVGIINDTSKESDETINLVLKNATGGVTLGTPNSVVITITDNDTSEDVPSSTPIAKITLKFQNLCRLSDSSSVKFQLSGTEGKSELKIYTISGKLVKALRIDSGVGEINWDLLNQTGDGIRPGIYLYTIVDSDKNRKTGKLVIGR